MTDEPAPRPPRGDGETTATASAPAAAPAPAPSAPAAVAAPLPPLTAVYGVHRPDSNIFKRGGMKREAPASRAPGGGGDAAATAADKRPPIPPPAAEEAADAGLDDATILKAKLDAMHPAWAAPKGR